MRSLDIGIVGYGTAGQAAAVLLHRAGHRVTVFERVAQPGPVGAGVLVQPTGLQVLQQLGLLAGAVSAGARVDALIGHSHRGRQVMDLRYQHLHPGLYGLGMQRGALFTLLDRAWPAATHLRAGHSIVDIDDEQGILIDSDGQHHGPFELLVIADGSASSLRQRCFAPAVRRDQTYPWGALWCLRDDPDGSFAGQLRQRYRGARQMLGVLPVGRLPGEPRQQQRVSLFWSMTAAELDHWRSEDFPALREQALALWPEIAVLLDQPDTATALTPARYRDVLLRRSQSGRSVLIGDAAHAMSPQLGQGVNMALMDAQALAAALSEHAQISTALAAHERQRQRHVAIYQLWSRWLTPIFQSHARLPAALRDQLFLPLGKLPLGKDQMLHVLTGTRQGLFGRLDLDLEQLAQHLSLANEPGCTQTEDEQPGLGIA